MFGLSASMIPSRRFLDALLAGNMLEQDGGRQVPEALPLRTLAKTSLPSPQR